MKILTLVLSMLVSLKLLGKDLGIGDKAPSFKTQTHDGATFDLDSRKGKWTVLYFYPKADTPGCTKQACGFRDSIEQIRKLDAEVFGISGDEVAKIKSFHTEQKLNFTLLADPNAKIITDYGVKMPVVNISKRVTFIIDPELKIRAINKDVDPVLDAKSVATKIQELKNSK